MKKTITAFFVLMVAGFLSQADIISADLGKSGTEALEAGDTAGVVPAANWTVASGFPDLAAFALNYSDGTASGAKITADFSGNLTTRVGVTTDVNTEMFNSGGGVLSGAGSNISISSIPVTGDWTDGYDVYVYFASKSDDNTDRTLNLTIGTTSYYAQLATGSSNYSGTFDLVNSTKNWERESGNYAKFSGITGSSFTLNATSDSASVIAITGMQIISIPEPATIGMIGFAGLLALLVRRRLMD